MKQKNSYADCTTAADLLMAVLKNVVLEFTKEKGIITLLEKTKYIEHKRLYRALRKDAPFKGAAFVFIMCAKYSIEHDDMIDIIFNSFLDELKTGINESNKV